MKLLKSEKFWWICLAAGIALLVAAVIVHFVELQMHTAANGPMYIIGGADMPTFGYILSQVPAYLALPGVLLFLAAAVCLVVKKLRPSVSA